MQNRTVKINFVDFYPDFNYQEFFLYKYLSQHYKVEISDNPDYLFCSCFGYKHWKYRDCIKIYFTAENLTPDFNIYDYGIGFHYITLGDRYLRFPLWLIYSWDELEQMQNKENIVSESLQGKEFCNFVYSNSKWADPIREQFYIELSRYKKIDSGGGYLNNIGYKVGNKLDFIKNYKFTIAIENSVVPGYTTEKIIEPMMVGSMPIYYGDPLVTNDFNMDACVHLRDFSSMQDTIDYIVALDQDEDLYFSKIKQGWFQREKIKEEYDLKLRHFFSEIFDVEKKDAVRIIDYGFARRYRKELSRTTPWSSNFFVEKIYGLRDRLRK